jgi:uncharacterized protein YbcI
LSATINEDHSGRSGSIAAAISNATVRRTAEYTGRGPTKARTIIRDDTIVVVLQDTLTKGEQALVAHDRAEKVIELRSEFQAAMSADLQADIEELMGRKVIAFMSANHIDPDLAAELFILEPEAAQTAMTERPAASTRPA